jgi:hypothetical protein
MREQYPENQNLMYEYFKPIAHWTDAIQNDFAARADWCVKPFDEANHPPVVKLKHKLNLKAKSGSQILLSANGTFDPDDDKLSYRWWQYKEAGTYPGKIEVENSGNIEASFIVPNDVQNNETIHIICEVSDNGIPSLTRYQRVIIEIY